MDKFHLRIFQNQVLMQCRFALIAAETVDIALKQERTDEIWFALQSLIVSGANIAKLLWGSPKAKKADARRELRESIEVDDSSPIKNVTMRNHFEHIDERIDRWWEHSTDHIHISRMIGPRDAIGGVEDTDIFHTYDPKTTDLIFWGEAYNLSSLVSEIIRITPLLEREVAKPSWD